MRDDPKVYYAGEIKKVLNALSHVYFSKPWYIRWYYKPWMDALVTIDLMLCDQEKKETIEDLFGIDES